MSRAGLYFKVFGSSVMHKIHAPLRSYTVHSSNFSNSGAAICICGPAFVYWVTPTEEELFKRYNPELQKRSLENRIGRQQEFDSFVCKLKEYSKSNKHIWEVAAEDEARKKADAAEEQTRITAEIQKRRDEIKKLSSAPEKSA